MSFVTQKLASILFLESFPAFASFAISSASVSLPLSISNGLSTKPLPLSPPFSAIPPNSAESVSFCHLASRGSWRHRRQSIVDRDAARLLYLPPRHSMRTSLACRAGCLSPLPVHTQVVMPLPLRDRVVSFSTFSPPGSKSGALESYDVCITLRHDPPTPVPPRRTQQYTHTCCARPTTKTSDLGFSHPQLPAIVFCLRTSIFSSPHWITAPQMLLHHLVRNEKRTGFL